MGWTCQYDYKGYCKRVKTMCEPGMKGCILQTTGVVFSNECPSASKEEKKEGLTKQQIDFAALARSC